MNLETLNPAARIRNARNGAVLRAEMSLRSWERILAEAVKARRETTRRLRMSIASMHDMQVATRFAFIRQTESDEVDVAEALIGVRSAEARLAAAKKLAPLVAVWRGR